MNRSAPIFSLAAGTRSSPVHEPDRSSRDKEASGEDPIEVTYRDLCL